MNENKHRVKGFTLMELIIVIAIIGILLGILMPSMAAYYRNARLKAANSDAKMVYNAVQTEIMKYASSDRMGSTHSGFDQTVWFGYTPDGARSFSKEPSPTALSTTTLEADNADFPIARACNEVITRVNRVVSGAPNVCWAVGVNNYIVKASVSAGSAGTNYVGFYSANRQQASALNATSYSAGYVNVLRNISSNYDHAAGNGQKSDKTNDQKPAQPENGKGN